MLFPFSSTGVGSTFFLLIRVHQRRSAVRICMRLPRHAFLSRENPTLRKEREGELPSTPVKGWSSVVGFQLPNYQFTHLPNSHQIFHPCTGSYLISSPALTLDLGVGEIDGNAQCSYCVEPPKTIPPALAK